MRNNTAPVVPIDPGHPSENGVGAHSNGVPEVHAAWEVAVCLRDLLDETGYRV